MDQYIIVCIEEKPELSNGHLIVINSESVLGHTTISYFFQSPTNE